MKLRTRLAKSRRTNAPKNRRSYERTHTHTPQKIGDGYVELTARGLDKNQWFVFAAQQSQQGKSFSVRN